MQPDTERLVPLDGQRTERSTVGLVRDIASDTGTLVRKEVELARQEIVEGVMAKVKGAGAFAAAGFFMMLACAYAGVAAASALQTRMAAWAAWLDVGLACVLLAGVAALIGFAVMRRRRIAPEMAIETTKEDVEWARAQLKR